MVISLNLKRLGLITPLSFPFRCIEILQLFGKIIDPKSECKYLRRTIIFKNFRANCHFRKLGSDED